VHRFVAMSLLAVVSSNHQRYHTTEGSHRAARLSKNDGLFGQLPAALIAWMDLRKGSAGRSQKGKIVEKPGLLAKLLGLSSSARFECKRRSSTSSANTREKTIPHFPFAFGSGKVSLRNRRSFILSECRR
jgi:hypothetical protein